MTYVRGRFLIGARSIYVEINRVSLGKIKGGESRTFNLPDGKHQVVFRYSFVTVKVDLSLSGEDSFTVYWDRVMGGMRIAKEFEGGMFFDSRTKKYLIASVILLAAAIAMYSLGHVGMLPVRYGLFISIVLLAAIAIFFIFLYRGMSRTYVWGEGTE